MSVGVRVRGTDGTHGACLRILYYAGSGRNEVRIAYVLKKDDLNRALFVLQKALEAYPGRTE